MEIAAAATPFTATMTNFHIELSVSSIFVRFGFVFFWLLTSVPDTRVDRSYSRVKKKAGLQFACSFTT